MKRFPPLNALRAFDAAARNSSFTAAGEELHVTHGAVSRQIQQLEDFLGRPVFRRVPRGVQLTAEGRELAVSIRRAFSEIAEAVTLIRVRDEDQRFLTISTLPGLAARWLFPRLHRFQKQHPDYEIRVTTSVELADFRRDGIDLAIRYGRGDWPGVAAHRLFGYERYPVCAPSLLRGPEALESPHDLARFNLLHDYNRRYWSTWLKFAGIDDVDPNQGWVLDEANAVLQAAIAGQGVALTSLPLVEADLKAGRLVKPFDIALPIDVAYYAVCPIESTEDPRVSAARQWLIAEACETQKTEV